VVKETRQNQRWKKKAKIKPAAPGETAEAAAPGEPRKTEEA
jgi:hypothetical protein